jgi:DNA-binding beta-propeller fold protein YncE
MSNHRKTAALFLYLTLVLVCLATSAGLHPAAAQVQTDEQQVALLGSPFGVATTHNGAFVFVSVSKSPSGVGNNGIEVLERASIFGYVYAGFVPLPTPPLGLAISPDGTLLLAAATTGVAFIDVQRAITGLPGAWLGSQFLGANAETIEVAITADQNYIFAANEDTGTISVINRVNALQSGFAGSAVIGQIPAEVHPVGLAISPDGLHLYVTNEEAKPGTAGFNPTACLIQSPSGTLEQTPEGTIQVVYIPDAESVPSSSVVSRAVVGCTPVRIRLSAAGDVAWVSMRGGDHLKAFNTAALLSDPASALIASAPVGIEPVGVQLFDNGNLIAVANSNRFNGGVPGTVSILSTSDALSNQPSTLKSFTVGVFPREWALSPDGSKLFLTEFGSSQLDIFDVPTLLSNLLVVSQ